MDLTHQLVDSVFECLATHAHEEHDDGPKKQSDSVDQMKETVKSHTTSALACLEHEEKAVVLWLDVGLLVNSKHELFPSDFGIPNSRSSWT